MESPHKRMRLSPPPAANLHASEDFVAFDNDEDGDDDNDTQGTRYGYSQDDGHGDPHSNNQSTRPRRAQYKDFRGQPWYDRKHAQDRPRSKHALPGHEPWVLVKTKLGRRFVYNTQKRESLWRIPNDVFEGVRELEREEARRVEKDENARWAEEELRKMRDQKKPADVDVGGRGGGGVPDGGARTRRRRSESLQREDEEAMMAELAAEDEQQDGEREVTIITKQPEAQQAGDVGYDSEGSYEYVEVTDSEGEEGNEPSGNANGGRPSGETEAQILEQGQDKEEAEAEEELPLEFGEDDIAYQLAAMGADYGLDPGEYGEENDEEDQADDYTDDGTRGLPISEAEATNLFRTMLDDHAISPFTPWETLLADPNPATSIVHDDRYLILDSTRARHEAWQAWTKDKAAALRAERARTEKKDPKVAYLRLVQELAGPKCKLYWAEFKRKFKRELGGGEVRTLAERERERLFRDYVARWKLGENARKADLITLLEEGWKKGVVERDAGMEELEGGVGGDVRWASLPAAVREEVVRGFLRGLRDVREVSGGGVVEKTEKEKRRDEALAQRRRQVDEERRKAGVEERFAKRGLREEEDELKRAMSVGSRGLGALLKEG